MLARPRAYGCDRTRSIYQKHGSGRNIVFPTFQFLAFNSEMFLSMVASLLTRTREFNDFRVIARPGDDSRGNAAGQPCSISAAEQ